MTKIQNRIQSTVRRFMHQAKSLFQGKKSQPELSSKTIDELLNAVATGTAYEYLNDVEPSNTIVLC